MAHILQPLLGNSETATNIELIAPCAVQVRMLELITHSTSQPKVVSEHLERVAQQIATRAAELLVANVVVVNDRGIIVASAFGRLCGTRFTLEKTDDSNYVRIPLHIDSCHAEVIVPINQDENVAPAHLTQVLVEMLINQVAVIDQLPSRNELKDRLIYTLLQGDIEDEDALLREAQILGIDLHRPRSAILVDASEFICHPNDSLAVESEQVRRKAQMVIASIVGFFKLPNDTICSYIGDGEVIVLKANTNRDLSAWKDGTSADEQRYDSWTNLAALRHAADALLAKLQRDTRSRIDIGIGRHHRGISGMSRSYQDARTALSVGRHFLGSDRVHCLDSLGLAAFIGVDDQSIKVDLAKHLLGPLDHDEELTETLAVFFAEDCSPSATARRLSIHRNTLTYRLQKIGSLTGLYPYHFDEAVQLRLALELRTLAPSSD